MLNHSERKNLHPLDSSTSNDVLYSVKAMAVILPSFPGMSIHRLNL